MRWIVRHGNIVEHPADALICSANVFLNLSGGVGGEILLRFGDGMQKELHKYLSDRDLRFVKRGDVFKTQSHGTPFKFVLHAVAVNGFYESSSTVVEETARKSLQMAAESNAKTISLTALATGFGRQTFANFATGITPLISADFGSIETVTIWVRHPDEAAQIVHFTGSRISNPDESDPMLKR